jgi:hypothetical protein
VITIEMTVRQKSPLVNLIVGDKSRDQLITLMSTQIHDGANSTIVVRVPEADAGRLKLGDMVPVQVDIGGKLGGRAI